MLIIIPLRRTSLCLVFNLCSSIVGVYKAAHHKVALDVVGYSFKTQAFVGEIEGCIKGWVVQVKPIVFATWKHF